MRAVRAVGKAGIVVGVDNSEGILKEARLKEEDLEGEEEGRASCEWFKADTNNLCNLPAVARMAEKGGFDVVSVCSAMMLLADPSVAFRLWTSFLKSGEAMILDTPTENKICRISWLLA